MLEDLVEEDTEDSKEVEGEEEVTAEVVVVTTPPIWTDLQIEMTASIATPVNERGGRGGPSWRYRGRNGRRQ